MSFACGKKKVTDAKYVIRYKNDRKIKTSIHQVSIGDRISQ